MYRVITFVIGFLAFTSTGSTQEAATFEGLGDLPGGSLPFFSVALDVTPDGSVVVGNSSSELSSNTAFRWENGVMENLQSESTFLHTTARGVSANGSAVVGHGNSENGEEAWLWEAEADTLKGLGDLPGGSFGSVAYAISADGSVVVGWGRSDVGLEAFRWEAAIDTMIGLGHFPNSGSFPRTLAYDVSTDGSVIVGYGRASSSDDDEAFRWEASADTMILLGDLSGGGFESQALSVSADGSTIVGYGTSANGTEAFRWTETEGMVGLGDLPGGGFESEAYGVSGDGSVVVGRSNTESDNCVVGVCEAFIWMEEDGMRNLKEVLETDYGLGLGGWTLVTAWGISSDGTTIVGSGTNPDGDTEAWRAFLGEPVSATTRYVDGTTGSDAGDCIDEASPCATISYAIEQATSLGDTINVAEGTYTEALNIQKPLHLRGASETGTIIQTHENPGEADSRVITIHGEHEVGVSNVTIRHGVASGDAPNNLGGGISSFNATVAMTNVTIINNSAESHGGGLRSESSSLVLSNVTFRENVAGGGGGGLYLRMNDSSTLTNVAFAGNESGTAGGGLHIFSNGETPLTNVVFHDNGADNGGGIYNILSAAVFTNVTIGGNVADTDGGGIVTLLGSTEAANSLIWGNSAGGTGNEFWNGNDATATLRYSIYSNGEGDIIEGGGFTAENSLTDDPLFVDPENGDLQLGDGSPAIDAGDPDTDPLLFPTDEDGNPIDLVGNPRFFGDEIDIGAYENQGIVADEASSEEITEGLTLPAPNPVRGVATLTVAAEESQDVTVEVFDATGRRVQTLYEGALSAGTSETLTVDASGFPAGLYIIRATGETFAQTRRITVVR